MINIKDIGQKQVAFLKEAADKGLLAHSYLLIDGDQSKALNTAYWLICYLNCVGDEKPDGKCVNCQRILNGNHPDVFVVEPEGNKKSISIDQVRPLKIELAKSPVEGDRRFFIIKQAQNLTLSAANALLNLLEEPVSPVINILISNNADQILPTIRSRTQIVNFDEDIGNDRNDVLLNYGLTQEEINSLGDTSDFDKQVEYFYKELLERNSLSIVSAHNLVSSKSVIFEKYILILLKEWARSDLQKNDKRHDCAQLLNDLIQIDKMRQSNVSFLNSLDYLALKWQK